MAPDEASAAGAGSLNPDLAARRVQIFVALFLVVFMVFGLFGIELWPLTGWRLFSRLRSDEQQGRQVSAVDPRGRETPLRFDSMPIAYQGSVQILKQFPNLSPKKRSEICRAWITEANRIGAGAARLKIYSTRWRLSKRAGRRAAPPKRKLEYICTGSGARPV